jgi:hypothetical protein
MQSKVLTNSFDGGGRLLKYNSIADCVQQVLKTEGVRGLYRVKHFIMATYE